MSTSSSSKTSNSNPRGNKGKTREPAKDEVLWSDNFKQLKRHVNAHGHAIELSGDLKVWLDTQLQEQETGTLQANRQSELQRLVDRGVLKWLGEASSSPSSSEDSGTSSTHSEWSSGESSHAVSALTKSVTSITSNASSVSSIRSESTVDLQAVLSSAVVMDEVDTSTPYFVETVDLSAGGAVSEEQDESVDVDVASVTAIPVTARRKTVRAAAVPIANATKKRLSASSQRRLDTATANEALWWRNFALLLEYETVHGHYNVPVDHVVAIEDGVEEVRLGEWLAAQHNKLFGMKNRNHSGALIELCWTGKLWGGMASDGETPLCDSSATTIAAAACGVLTGGASLVCPTATSEAL
eukprot:gene31233-38594_t